MSLPDAPGAAYYDDGHTISFRWERDQVVIGSVHCPHRGRTSVCNRNRDNCVVDTYLMVYGVELNIGDTWIGDSVEIAWIPMAGESDLDEEFGSVWVIPVDDENFVAVKDLEEQFALTSDDVMQEGSVEDGDVEVLEDTITPLPEEDDSE